MERHFGVVGVDGDLERIELTPLQLLPQGLGVQPLRLFEIEVALQLELHPANDLGLLVVGEELRPVQRGSEGDVFHCVTAMVTREDPDLDLIPLPAPAWAILCMDSILSIPIVDFSYSCVFIV